MSTKLLKIIGNNYEYNNKENLLLTYHPQMDAFGWVFFDGADAFLDNGWTDPRFISKYQMVKEIIAYESGETFTYNYAYTYDNNGKITEVDTNADIPVSTFSYICN